MSRRAMSTTILLRTPYHLNHHLKLFKNICRLQLPCHLTIDDFVKHTLLLVQEFSLKTNISSIYKNDAPEQPLVSRLATNAEFILWNNATALKLVSSLAN